MAAYKNDICGGEIVVRLRKYLFLMILKTPLPITKISKSSPLGTKRLSLSASLSLSVSPTSPLPGAVAVMARRAAAARRWRLLAGGGGCMDSGVSPPSSKIRWRRQSGEQWRWRRGCCSYRWEAEGAWATASPLHPPRSGGGGGEGRWRQRLPVVTTRRVEAAASAAALPSGSGAVTVTLPSESSRWRRPPLRRRL